MLSTDSGTPLIPYKDLVKIGEGGMGVVYTGTHVYLGRLQAVKVMAARLAADPHAKERFLREMRAVGKLEHPNIVQALDAQEAADGTLYLAMEYVPGEDLDKYVGRVGPLPVAEACGLAAQVGRGLRHAHDSGFVHRDIKPRNLMRTTAGGVKILDFGLALSKSGLEERLTGGMAGTPGFMAPEQRDSAHDVDGRADLYSLGATLFFLLTKQVPRTADRPLRELRPDVPEALANVVARMLAPSPADRHATAGEVVAALTPFLPAEAEKRTPPTPAAAPTPRPGSRLRRPFAWCAAAAVALAALIGLGLSARPAAPVRLSGDHEGYCGSIAFTPDGRYAVSESGGGAIHFWDLERGVGEAPILHGHQQPQRFQGAGGVVTVSPDGKRFAAAGLSAEGGMLVLQVYDFATRKPTGQDSAYAAVPSLGRALAFSPDGTRIALTEVPPDGLVGAGFALASKVLPTDFRTRVHTIGTEKESRLASPSPVRSLAFSPDGGSLVTGSDDGSLWAWNTQPAAAARRLGGHDRPVTQVGISHDGRQVFSGSIADGTLRVWAADLPGGEVRQLRVEDDMGRMTCVAFWPGGRALTGHADGVVAVWDLTTGERVWRGRHPAAVTAVAVSPDGRRAVAATSDHAVYLSELSAARGLP